MESALPIFENHPSNNTITFNEDVLHTILTKKEVKDRYISVVSINGPSRQGKSFLLNFFLRYLKNAEKRDITKWLTSEDGPLQGFSWAPGSKRHTTGIMMWPEVFLANRDSGEKVAIILLDTQGSFDKKSSMNDCAKIFALSTLISSTQIYNVMRDIKQYDLSHLQCFGGYGCLLTDCNSTPFQNLYFLVRDWPSPYEHPYGDIGGAALLAEVFHSNESEVKEQVENIEDLFEKINCFLLPYPGRVVDTSNTYDGNLNDIDDIFKDQVQDLTISLLSPENLVLKTVNGSKVTGEELFQYIKEYSRIMEEDTLPKVQTIFQATVEAQHRVAFNKAVKVFKKAMDLDVKHHSKYSNEDELFNKFAANKVKAVNYFNKSKKVHDEVISDKYLVKLTNVLDAEFKHYRAINEEKRRIYEETKRRMEETILRSQQSQKSAGMDQLSTGQQLGVAVGVVGGVAAVAFGLSKVLGSRGLNATLSPSELGWQLNHFMVLPPVYQRLFEAESETFFTYK